MNTPNYTPPIRVLHKVTTPSGGEDVVESLEEAVKIICEDTGYEVELVHSTAIVYELQVSVSSNDPRFLKLTGMRWVYRDAREAENDLGKMLGVSERSISGDTELFYTLRKVEVYTDGRNTPVRNSDITAVTCQVKKKLFVCCEPSIVWNAAYMPTTRSSD